MKVIKSLKNNHMSYSHNTLISLILKTYRVIRKCENNIKEVWKINIVQQALARSSTSNCVVLNRFKVMGIFLTQVAIIVSNVYSYLFYFLYSVTLGCLIQEEGRLLSFRFFTAHSHLIKTSTFINFIKRSQKSGFISMHKGQNSIYLVLYLYWRLLEKMSLHCIHVLRRWFEKILLYYICILRIVFITRQIL